jgi:hypothetical protein
LDSYRSTPYNGGGAAVRQNWENIWAKMKVSYVAWHFNARALSNTSSGQNNAYNSWFNEIVGTWKSKSEMNDLLQVTCGQARTEGVLVYGIAFQAPVNGWAQISACATDPTNYYFDAGDGAALKKAFNDIATNLTQLRLTQ